MSSDRTTACSPIAMLSADDRDAIAEGVSERLRAQDDKQAPWLKTAGEAVGLVAGAVAVVYVLGGFVLAARLLLDSVTLAEAVGVVGQLSREFLITAGMVLVVSLAAVVGLVAGVIVGLADRVRPPDRLPDKWPDLKSRVGQRNVIATWVALIPLALVLMVPGAVLQYEEPVLSRWEWAAFVLAFVTQYAVILAGWRALRGLALRGAPRTDDSERSKQLREAENRDTPGGGAVAGNAHLHGMHRRRRGIRAGLLWAAMALPAAILFSSLVGFERARVCAAGSVEGQKEVSIQGRLVADTRDAVLLVVSLQPDRVSGSAKSSPAGGPETTVVRIPSSRIVRLQYGAPLHLLPECDGDVRGPSFG